jgi:hypothetical protein
MKTYIWIAAILLTAIGIAGCGKSGNQSGDSTQNQTQNLLAERPQLSAMESDPSVAAPYSCGNAGVAICHLPPGNPNARHSLCIGAPAVAHHIAEHRRGDLGDYLGACLTDTPETGGTGDGSGSTTGGTGSTGSGSTGGGQVIDCTDPANQSNSLCQ